MSSKKRTLTNLEGAKPKDKKSLPESCLPWVEKYRPKSVEDVAYQEEVVKTLRSSIESKNLPHLLFYGPPGTGKTSTILAIGRTLYGDNFKERVKELNASDERGIGVVRTSIKSFAQIAIPNSSNSSSPPYKLIILDEADSMTQDAQAALRRTMEEYSKTTRFCLICNYVSRIIEPLASRCAKFRFKPLTQESIEERIQFICQKEKAPYTESLAKTLCEVSGGDLRKAITLLQSAFTLYQNETNSQSIIEIAGVVPPSAVKSLLSVCRSNSFPQLQKEVKSTIGNGYPAAQIIQQLFDQILESKDISDLKKAKIAEVLAISDKALQEGSDEYLQLMNVLATIMKEFHL
eukprot:TRINITY_DN8880_c0_g1_i1.p1 TRINITY_DN8880_c0_g1~~TRINITY_DN8880_c0_g1_i1.p1  ORF type:complete len:383 (-),score=108.25 TRINITY_DN8880_c0_g1_i1:40-1083(-)